MKTNSFGHFTESEINDINKKTEQIKRSIGYVAKISDSTPFGTSNKNHIKHVVSVDGLTHEEAKQLCDFINTLSKEVVLLNNHSLLEKHWYYLDSNGNIKKTNEPPSIPYNKHKESTINEAVDTIIFTYKIGLFVTLSALSVIIILITK